MDRRLLTALILALVGFTGRRRPPAMPRRARPRRPPAPCVTEVNGQGTQIAPKLAGMDPAKFVQALEDLKSGKLSNPMMTPQAAPLNTEDMQNLAAYYVSLQ